MADRFGCENIVDMVTVSTAPGKCCHTKGFRHFTGPDWFRSLNS